NYAGALWVPRKGTAAATHVYLVQNGRLYTSTNGGTNFVQGATIDAGADRALLVGSEAGAPTLYAALRSGGSWTLHRSTNAGASFSAVHAIGDFYESLEASS